SSLYISGYVSRQISLSILQSTPYGTGYTKTVSIVGRMDGVDDVDVCTLVNKPISKRTIEEVLRNKRCAIRMRSGGTLLRILICLD
ncbi:MAG: hypothetical protein M3Z24_05215, partial [Chloroflexota bacterium]|nr:hypothetical protein [Chloroflexota bacterium]